MHTSLPRIVGLILLCLGAGTAMAEDPPSRVPRTGQIITYAFGDDGDQQAGIASPKLRFRDDADGTVVDQLTGLMWMKDADAGGDCDGPDRGFKSWEEAIGSADACNAKKFAGYNDWRLPSLKELLSLHDYGHANPPLPTGHPFQNVGLRSYWTSTSYAENGAWAWRVSFCTGDVARFPKEGSTYYVWLVRGGK